VRKAEHFARLLHLYMTGKGLGVIVALLILAASSAQAAEPTLTLALAHDPQPQEKTFVATYGNLMSGTDSSFSDFSLKDGEPETISLLNEKAPESLPNVRLEKQTNSDHRDPFQIVHENLTASSRSNLSFSLQAGYGRIWDEKSMLQKIVSDRQEPGCAYVSADFSF
jgi:opacity protein-like surface antigen